MSAPDQTPPASDRTSPASPEDGEPRWPAILAVLAVGALRFALPKSLSVGPAWLLLAVVTVLLVPTILARRFGQHSANRTLGFVLSSVITLDMLWSLGRLVSALPAHRVAPGNLLRSGVVLWLTNILVFASWYWRLDAGGPRSRELRHMHADGAFLFPQMTLNPELTRELDDRYWSPRFIDYLFLAFNTSTAFAPTDAPVLSRWAKVLMMVQVLISLATVALLVARAINIL